MKNSFLYHRGEHYPILALSTLDKEMQKEVIDFYEFLKSKNTKAQKDVNKYNGEIKNIKIEPLEFKKRIRDELLENTFNILFVLGLQNVIKNNLLHTFLSLYPTAIYFFDNPFKRQKNLF